MGGLSSSSSSPLFAAADFFLFFDDELPFTLPAAEDVSPPFPGFPVDPLYVEVGVGACDGVVCAEGAGESYTQRNSKSVSIHPRHTDIPRRLVM